MGGIPGAVLPTLEADEFEDHPDYDDGSVGTHSAVAPQEGEEDLSNRDPSEARARRLSEDEGGDDADQADGDDSNMPAESGGSKEFADDVDDNDQDDL